MATTKKPKAPAKKKPPPDDFVVYLDGSPHRVFKTESEANGYVSQRSVGGDLPRFEVKPQWH